ncbi:MAG: cobalamin-dependent protein [Alphaproteobacteria bacterium]
MTLDRRTILPEAELPDGAALLAEGRKAAETTRIGRSAFLTHYGVESEAAYKRRCAEEGRVMFHAQIGFRDAAKTRRTWVEIYEALDKAGYRIDRYGCCFDWCMGYPRAHRKISTHGTGMVLDEAEEWLALTQGAPVAPHFGDHSIGTPAAFENTTLALLAGSTTIGNLGQYFTYRQPNWDDDVYTTVETVKAVALTAAQPVEVLVHSNIDDGFAALFTDLACSLGAVLLEQYVVEDLCGGHMGHCYGNTFAQPFTRLAFQRAVHAVARAPGTMIYGATTMYGENHPANYAALAAYIRADAYGQRTRPSGHAITPVPITEAERIPDIDEIIDVHMFANRWCELDRPCSGPYSEEEIDALAETIVEGGRRFKASVLKGLVEAGIDVKNPIETLLALRRVGAKRLEELYGPGKISEGHPRGREPLVYVGSIEEIEQSGRRYVAAMEQETRERIRKGRFKILVATTDVHEYGKMLIESVLRGLDAEIVDGGTSTVPADIAARARAVEADAIAVSTYNGVALEYMSQLRAEMKRLGLDLPVFVGGRLNRVPDGSNTALPVDVSKEIAGTGAIVCQDVTVMLDRLAGMAHDRAA